MLSKEELKEKAEKFNAFLQKVQCNDEPAAMMGRLEHLDILISKSGECLADAKYFQDEMINGVVIDSLKKSLEKSLSATTINLYVKSCAKDINFLVNSLDRINRAAVHQQAALITRISFVKSQMSMR